MRTSMLVFVGGILADMLGFRSLFINTALLLWAFRICEDSKNPIDTLAFTNTANMHPLPFSVRFEPRKDVKELEQLLRET